MLAKPTGCIILSPPCACRFIVIASFGYAYRFTVMHMVRSIPCRCYLSEKKKRVDSACWTGCLCVCDGCAGYVSTPWAGKPDNQLYAIVKFLCEKEKPFRPSVAAVWKALDLGSESIPSRIFFWIVRKGDFFMQCIRLKWYWHVTTYVL